VILRPRTEPAVTALSLRVGLAVAEVIESACPAAPVRLKWPNDLLLRDRKLGGILCEARWQDGVVGWVTVGIGLNVRNSLPDALRTGAVALVDCCPAIDPAYLAEAIVERVAPLAEASGPLDTGEQAAFARRDWLRGRELSGPVAGTAAGVGADGSLLVRAADGRVAPVRAGSPILVDSAGHGAHPG
jgi:BirA family biotin operon repressor/biotin-[acetyl-CoA-carboxylase] ligase